MPFEDGSFSVSFFELRDKLPENCMELFQNYAAGTLDSIKDEPQIGLVSGRHLLETELNEQTVSRGSCYYLNLRKAERKVPASLLNAICKREELVYMKANNAPYVSGKIKKQIRSEVVEQYLMKMPPQISALPFVIDPGQKVLYLGNTSRTKMDDFVGLFYKMTGLEPVQMSPALILDQDFQTTVTSFPSLSFGGNQEDEPSIGRDFFTWLWYYSETCGKLELGNFGEFDVMIEAPATFEFSADAPGCNETVVKKGASGLRSSEVKAALTVGKKLRKAKVSFTRAGDIWSAVFDADAFAFTSVKLPEGEVLEAESRFEERMFNLNILKMALRGYFHKFASLLLSPEREKIQNEMLKWAAEHEEL